MPTGNYKVDDLDTHPNSPILSPDVNCKSWVCEACGEKWVDSDKQEYITCIGEHCNSEDLSFEEYYNPEF